MTPLPFVRVCPYCSDHPPYIMMMPLCGRALLALLALSRTVETTGRNTAGDLDPAFWHGDSREFEGEATWARAVWGPLIAEESASRLALGNLQAQGQHGPRSKRA